MTAAVCLIGGLLLVGFQVFLFAVAPSPVVAACLVVTGGAFLISLAAWATR